MSFSSPIWLLALLLVPLGAGRTAPRRAGEPGATRCGSRPCRRSSRRRAPGPIGAGTSRSRWRWRRSRRSASRWPARTSPTGSPCARRRWCSCSTARARWTPTTSSRPACRRRARRQHFIDQLPSTRESAWSRSRARPTRSSRRRPTTWPRAAAIGSQTADGATATGDALSVALNLLHKPSGDAPRGDRAAVRRRRQRGPGSGHGRAPGRQAEDRDLHGRARHRRTDRCRTPIRSGRRSRFRPTRS